MHLQRWITGIIAFPLLVWLIFKAGALFLVLLVMLVALLTLREYFRAVFKPLGQPPFNAVTSAGYAVTPLLIWSGYTGRWDTAAFFFSVALLLVAFISLFRFKRDPAAMQSVVFTAFGVCYISLFLSMLVSVRSGPDGAEWIFSVLSVIFAGDTGAYYAGSYLGRNKLIPWVSPKKTVEGAAGGIAANLAVGAILKYFLLPALPWAMGLFFFACLGVAGQVGDLFESVVKRTAGIKDSGGLLPGHGGIWDRIDALLFAAPVAFYFKTYVF